MPKSELVCKGKNAAIATLEALTETMSGTQRDAMRAVAEWVQKNYYEHSSRLTHEERKVLIKETTFKILEKEGCYFTDPEKQKEFEAYLQKKKEEHEDLLRENGYSPETFNNKAKSM